MNELIIVGISGVTNGGKSRLTQQILKFLPLSTKVISQDDYFYSEDSPFHVYAPGGIKHFNWDIISSINMERMKTDIKHIITLAKENSISNETEPENSQKTSIVKVEKNEIDNHSLQPKWRELRESVLGKSYHIQMKKCSIVLIEGFLIFSDSEISRLCNLQYFLTLDKETCWKRRQTRHYDPPDPPGYFEMCSWPMYEEHLKFIKQFVPNLTYIDGTRDANCIALQVYEDILKMIKIIQ